MKIAIIGANYLSVAIASLLTEKFDVTLLDLEQHALTNIKARGVEVRGAKSITVPEFRIQKIEEMDSDFKFVFIFTNAVYNDILISMLKNSLLSPAATIVSFQESLSDEQLIQAFSPQPVLSATCNFYTLYQNYNIVDIVTEKKELDYYAFHLFDNEHADYFLGEEVKNILDEVGQTILIRQPTNIKWTKAVFLGAVDRLAGALNCKFGDIAHHPVALKAAIHIADEIVRIAKKRKIRLANNLDANYNDFIIDSDNKVAELMPIFQQILKPHLASESSYNQHSEHAPNLIEELIHLAVIVDQPTPFLDILYYCLNNPHLAEFHTNIALFEPLIQTDQAI